MAISRPIIALACALAAVAPSQLGARADDMLVDLQLVLAVDISPSMNFAEQKIQREGYAAALRKPEVVAAITSGALGRIAVTYVEWAEFQINVIPWTLVDGSESADNLAARIERLPFRLELRTSLSGALSFSAALFDRSSLISERRVIDVSGDGPNNSGSPVITARDAVVASGITINGLPIMLDGRGIEETTADLDLYFHECVIGGPGAFAMPVTKLDELANTIKRKLLVEILMSGRRTDVLVISDERATVPGPDCMIGEKMRVLR